MKSNLTPADLSRALSLMDMVQDDFAIQLNVRGATVSRWLSGKIPVPGYVEAWLEAARPEVLKEIKDGE